MKKVAIYGQAYYTNAREYIEKLLSLLNQYNSEILIEESFNDQLKENNIHNAQYRTFNHFNDLDTSIDLMFTIGGDGTILRAITYIRDSNIPILGINTGRLGFLATVQKDEIQNAIELVLKNEYNIQERTLLSVKSNPPTEAFEELNFALNEITIARKNTASMIGIETFLDEEYLTNYWADGLIISTPTGSTGYSLSCQGPVITSDVKGLTLTPIAPHNLNARPLVIPNSTKIKLNVKGRENQFLISLDSRICTVDKKTEIFIEKADFKIKIIQLKNQSFFKTLRTKLLWGEDTRNQKIV